MTIVQFLSLCVLLDVICSSKCSAQIYRAQYGHHVGVPPWNTNMAAGKQLIFGGDGSPNFRATAISSYFWFFVLVCWAAQPCNEIEAKNYISTFKRTGGGESTSSLLHGRPRPLIKSKTTSKAVRLFQPLTCRW